MLLSSSSSPRLKDQSDQIANMQSSNRFCQAMKFEKFDGMPYSMRLATRAVPVDADAADMVIDNNCLHWDLADDQCV
jgi:hypothetical protein